jgi:hypothetical protein
VEVGMRLDGLEVATCVLSVDGESEGNWSSL